MSEFISSIKKLSFYDMLKMSKGDIIPGFLPIPEYNKIYKVDIIDQPTPQEFSAIVLVDSCHKICFGNNENQSIIKGINIITLKQGFHLFDSNQGACPPRTFLSMAKTDFGFRKITFEKNIFVGLFMGNILRDSNYKTRINVMTFNGLNIWIEC